MPQNTVDVTLIPVNRVKEADRLIEGDLIIVNGGVLATLKCAEFSDDRQLICLCLDVRTNVTGPHEQVFNVDRKFLFNVVEMRSK